MKAYFTNPVIIVALVGFLSAILGASIGAWTTYILAVRKEKADRELENRRRLCRADGVPVRIETARGVMSDLQGPSRWTK